MSKARHEMRGNMPCDAFPDGNTKKKEITTTNEKMKKRKRKIGRKRSKQYIGRGAIVD